ncbi:PREDICTED: PRUPE_1G121400 [Prunus dulcis]|uniref:PREDICTED: PRUPE_1G121400 n=1 Tax=Prunus dulcis TaxID=3755 RepID=A0A5E4FB30_PRUDU|nr:hypothetical protein L3X38_002164 [Prunus dulcis]VVA24610.1 PREDICTED: PRUPE_1G121400 [Prunus dulcis]
MACSSFRAVISCCCCCFKCEETHQPVKDPQPPPKNYDSPKPTVVDPQPPPKNSDSPKPTVVDPRAGMTFNIHGNEISNNKADDVGLSQFGNKKNGGPNANNQDGGSHGAKQGGGDKLHLNLQGESDKVCFNLEGNKIHGNQAKNVGFSEFGNA